MPDFYDDELRLFARGDNTKQVLFDLSNLATATERTLKAPNISGTLSLIDGAQTWSALQKFPDNMFSVVGSVDATKIAVFEVDGFTTATTRTFTLPNVSGTVALTSDLPTVDAARTWATLQKFPDDKFQIIGSVTPSKILTIEVDGLSIGTNVWRAPNLADLTVAGINVAQTWTGIQTFDSEVAVPMFRGDPEETNNFLKLQDVGTGLGCTFVMPGGGYTTERTVEFPDLSGTLMLLGAVQTVSNKTLGTTANTLRANTSSSGVAFVDNATTTKLLRMILSGAVGSNTFTVANVAARDYKFGDDTGTMDAIVAPSSATVNLTGKTASVVATTAYTTVHAGFYRLTAYAVFTAVTTPGNLTITALYTDPQQAQTNAFTGATAYAAAGSLVQGECQFYATTGSVIQFSTTLTGVGTYNVYCRVESLT